MLCWKSQRTDHFISVCIIIYYTKLQDSGSWRKTHTRLFQENANVLREMTEHSKFVEICMCLLMSQCEFITILAHANWLIFKAWIKVNYISYWLPMTGSFQELMAKAHQCSIITWRISRIPKCKAYQPFSSSLWTTQIIVYMPNKTGSAVPSPQHNSTVRE